MLVLLCPYQSLSTTSRSWSLDDAEATLLLEPADSGLGHMVIHCWIRCQRRAPCNNPKITLKITYIQKIKNYIKNHLYSKNYFQNLLQILSLELNPFVV